MIKIGKNAKYYTNQGGDKHDLSRPKEFFLPDVEGNTLIDFLPDYGYRIITKGAISV
jgi:hypothetical protein